MHEWLLKKKYKYGLSSGKDFLPLLDEDDFQSLSDFCGCDEATGERYVTKVDQWHGQWLEFEPGMLHQVQTWQPCVKFAYDTYRFDRLQKYLNVWLHIMCGFMASREPESRDNADDYMQVLGLIKKELLTPWRINVPQ